VIDDFGTGYFSLSHLRQFPVDALKVASEFVQVSEADSRSSALAGGIVALSESLDIVTVAEGIETAEQANRMRALGCTYGQGYFFGKPVGPELIDEGVEGLAVRAVSRATAEDGTGREAPPRIDAARRRRARLATDMSAA
jgi:EAL domain-containing protein (putative c-di-GMP-specific phosphodiesterase class I)